MNHLLALQTLPECNMEKNCLHCHDINKHRRSPLRSCILLYSLNIDSVDKYYMNIFFRRTLSTSTRHTNPDAGRNKCQRNDDGSAMKHDVEAIVLPCRRDDTRDDIKERIPLSYPVVRYPSHLVQIKSSNGQLNALILSIQFIVPRS